MRRWFLLALIACRSRETPPRQADEPRAVASRPVDAQPIDARPRGGDEVDGIGVGRLVIGTPASELPNMGFAIEGQQGSASFMQNGKNVATSVRFGATAKLQRAGVEQLEVDIEPARMTVDHIRVVGPMLKTFEGIGVRDTVEKLHTVYGSPEDSYERFAHGTCEQFTRRPGVDFCIRGGEIAEMIVPALHRSPLDLGEDLSAIRKAIDGHVIGGQVLRGDRLGDDTLTLIAPCVVADHDRRSTAYWPIVAQAGAVYASSGGWRRKDGSVIVCDSDVFEIAPSGEAKRWYVEDSRWAAEPAECTVTATNIWCRGATQMSDGFRGIFVGDLVMYNDEYAERRALAPGAPLDDCDRIVERVIAALPPTFELLHAKLDPIAYLDTRVVHRFISDCTQAKDRACLLHAKDILRVAQPQCDLEPPSLADELVPEPDPRPLTPQEQRARAAAVVGTWERIGKSHLPDVEWKFTAAGHIVINGTDRGRYSFPRVGELFFESDREKTTFAFARGGAKQFYAYDTRIDCGSRVTLDSGDTLLLPDCKIISPTGALSDATCAQTATTVDVQFTSWHGKHSAEQWRIIDGCYVHHDVDAFVRRR